MKKNHAHYPYSLREYSMHLVNFFELREKEVRLLIPHLEAVEDFSSDVERIAMFIKHCDICASNFAGRMSWWLADLPEFEAFLRSLDAMLLSARRIDDIYPGRLEKIFGMIASANGDDKPATLHGFDYVLKLLKSTQTPSKRGVKKTPKHSSADWSFFICNLWKFFPKDGQSRGRFTRFVHCIDPLLNREDSSGRLWKIKTRFAVARAKRSNYWDLCDSISRKIGASNSSNSMI